MFCEFSMFFVDQYMKLNHNQLAGLIQESSLKVVSEYVLFDLVLKWIKHDFGPREQYTAQLMQNVRLPLLSGEELVEKVSENKYLILCYSYLAGIDLNSWIILYFDILCY